MLLHPGLDLCQKICPVPSLEKLDERWPFWRLCFLKTRSLIALREYGAGGNPSGVREVPRNRLAPLIEIQLKNDVYQC